VPCGAWCCSAVQREREKPVQETSPRGGRARGSSDADGLVRERERGTERERESRLERETERQGHWGRIIH